MAEADFKRDRQLIQALARLLEESGLGEIDYERGGVRVRLVRNANPPVALPAAAPPVVVARTGGQVEGGGASAAGEEGKSEVTGRKIVRSPVVGTVYFSSEPGADPFVKIGDYVTSGQPLLIIEVMKTMNLVHAPADGVVREIMVKNATAVEYGQALMALAMDGEG